MSYFLPVSQAPHASFYNGGEGVTARQYYIRPSQRIANGPRIAAALAGIAQGEFRTVWANNSDGIFSVRRPSDNASFDILDWTPHGVWDAPTQQVLIGGRRGLTKIIGYADETGDWRELPMPAVLGRQINGTVHYYGKIARNPLTGVVYFGTSENDSKLFALEPGAESWTQLATAPTANNGNGGSFEWAGDTERLVQYVGAAGRWLIYNPGSNSWTNPFNTLGHGQHAILRYHATHARHLLVGGTDTSTRASLVTSAGVVTNVTAVPDVIAMSSGSWAVAHPAGCWIVKTMGTTPKVYACWPNAGLTDVTWDDLGTAPDAALSLPTLIPGYSADTVLIVSTSGLHAWRLPSFTTAGGAAAVVAVVATGAGAASEAASGGGAALVGVVAVGAGIEGLAVSGGGAAIVAVAAVGAGTAGGVTASGGAAIVGVRAVGAGVGAEAAAGGGAAVVAVLAVGAGTNAAPVDDTYPLAGLNQSFPLAGQSQTYPLAG